MGKTLVIINSLKRPAFHENELTIRKIQDRCSRQPNTTLLVQGVENTDIGGLLSKSIPQNENFSCVFITKSRGSLELIREANKQLSDNHRFQSASFLVIDDAVQYDCPQPSNPNKLNADALGKLAKSTEPYSLDRALHLYEKTSAPPYPDISGFTEYDDFVNTLNQANDDISIARSKCCTSAKHDNVNHILNWLDEAINIVSEDT